MEYPSFPVIHKIDQNGYAGYNEFWHPIQKKNSGLIPFEDEKFGFDEKTSSKIGKVDDRKAPIS